MEKPEAPPTKSGGYKKIIAIVVVIIVIAGIGIGVYEFTHPVKKTVYFYTWWATEGKIAFNKEAKAFEAAHPGYVVEPTIKAGAGGTAAKGAILALIKEGHPPATFQTHLGPEILSYISAAPHKAGSFVKLNSAASSINLTTSTAFPQVLLAGTYNGSMYSLPVDMHQGAQLYLNPQVLAANHLPIPLNFTALMNDTAALKAKGVTPWIIPGNDGGWDQMQNWEDTFLALDNAAYGNGTLYDEFMYGTHNLSNPAVSHLVSKTNSNFLTMQNNSYNGEASMTWTQAIPKVVGKNVAFEANGNWYVNYAYDYLNTTTYPANSTYVYMNNGTLKPAAHNIKLMSMDFPGTSKYFVLVSDSAAVPSGSTSANGLTFAKFFASYSGQKAFTKWKAATFYNNITTNYYNTPSQWASYQQAKADANTPSDWLYQLSDGGLFDGPFSTMITDMLSLASTPTSSGIHSWDHSLSGILSTEQAEWKTANTLGLGFMGTLSHPFGGYLPPWAGSNTPSTAAVDNATHNSNTQALNNSSSIYYIVAPFIALFLGSLIMGDKR